MRIWKDYTSEDASAVAETAMKSHQPWTINSHWRKLSRWCMTSQDFWGANQGKHEKDSGCGKKGQGWRVKLWILENFKSKQTPQQRNDAGDDLGEINASTTVPEDGHKEAEAATENKRTLDNLAMEFQLCKTALTSLRLIWILLWYSTETIANTGNTTGTINIYREMKKGKKSDGEFTMYFDKAYLPPFLPFYLLHDPRQ